MGRVRGGGVLGAIMGASGWRAAYWMCCGPRVPSFRWRRRLSLRLKLLLQPWIGQYQVFGGRSWRSGGTGDVGTDGREIRSFLMRMWLEMMLRDGAGALVRGTGRGVGGVGVG